MSEIICAISTPSGMGAIAVIRLSGAGAIALVDTIFRGAKNKKLIHQPAYSVHFGKIMRDEHTLDEVLVTLFHAPHSFTGEESVEIACHGSPFIQQQLIQLLIEKGARLAKAGEFTRRAFRNGKMDLSQAEAVADLIASTSRAAHRVAMNQMRGGFADALSKLREQLLRFVSLIELELDFSEEDVEFVDRSRLVDLVNKIDAEISSLVESFSVGNAIKNGIPVAIIGETNVGKSTLLNYILNEEKAIVSDIHGTTRDTIEDTVQIGGVLFRFIDTAGIRHTTDMVESLGIERTFQKIDQSSIVLWIIDLTKTVDEIEATAHHILPKLHDKQVILLFNKSDLLSCAELQEKNSLLTLIDAERLFVSIKQRQNMEQLYPLLQKAAHIPEIGQSDIIVSNLRHFEALKKAQDAIHRVQEGLTNTISNDFLSQDIRECLFHIGEITGHISTDEILGNIFRNFCIGK